MSYKNIIFKFDVVFASITALNIVGAYFIQKELASFMLIASLCWFGLAFSFLKYGVDSNGYWIPRFFGPAIFRYIKDPEKRKKYISTSLYIGLFVTGFAVALTSLFVFPLLIIRLLAKL